MRWMLGLTAALAAVLLAGAAAACSEQKIVDSTFVVAPGEWREQRFTLSERARVTFAWSSVNRNSSPSVQGTRAGAADGSPGDIDVSIGDATWPRSVRNEVTLDLDAGAHAIRFSNGFSLVTSKEVSLVITVR